MLLEATVAAHSRVRRRIVRFCQGETPNAKLDFETFYGGEWNDNVEKKFTEWALRIFGGKSHLLRNAFVCLICLVTAKGSERRSLFILGDTNAQPEATAAQPVAVQPVAAQPVVTQPVVTQPVVTQPVVTQPVVTQPVVTQPVVTQPVVTQPEAIQPEAIQPGVSLSESQTTLEASKLSTPAPAPKNSVSRSSKTKKTAPRPSKPGGSAPGQSLGHVIIQPSGVVGQPSQVASQPSQVVIHLPQAIVEPPLPVVAQPPPQVVIQPPQAIVQPLPQPVVEPSPAVAQPPPQVVIRPPQAIVQPPPQAVVQSPLQAAVQPPPPVVARPPSQIGIQSSPQVAIQAPDLLAQSFQPLTGVCSTPNGQTSKVPYRVRPTVTGSGRSSRRDSIDGAPEMIVDLVDEEGDMVVDLSEYIVLDSDDESHVSSSQKTADESFELVVRPSELEKTNTSIKGTAQDGESRSDRTLPQLDADQDTLGDWLPKKNRWEYITSTAGGAAWEDLLKAYIEQERRLEFAEVVSHLVHILPNLIPDLM